MSQHDEEQPDRGFKVSDRRRFADDADAAPATAKQEDLRPHDMPEGARPEPVEGDDAIAMTFSTFVISLSTQALVHLGEIADPVAQQVRLDLPAARQMIDLIGILSEKTKGNLDAAEEQLLGSMLYDLRVRYVEVSRHR